MQQSVFQQAEAAAAAQSDPASSTRQGGSLQQIGVLNELAEDDVPPPAYGEIYGEIRNDMNGQSTIASVTDDGRVNIRINQLNQHLSQILTPALRQQVQDANDSHTPLTSPTPISPEGEQGIRRLPPLSIVIQVVGARGDVQPFVALGKVLKDVHGHRVRLATHLVFKDLVQEHGLEFFNIGGDPSRLMAFMVKNPGMMPGFRSLVSGDVRQRRQDVSEYIQGCWRSCYEAGDGGDLHATGSSQFDSSADDSNSELAASPFIADCIIANPPSFAHVHCAERLGIPLHIMFTMPYSPTQTLPHPLANIQSSNADPQLTNYASYAMIELLSWQGIGDIINRFRAKCLGLDPISMIWAPGMLHRLKVPHTYCWSPALVPKPKDWGPHLSIAGSFVLKPASEYIPSHDLQTFLEAGPPPIYIGFGSIVLDDPFTMTKLIFQAVRKTGQRVLLSRGMGAIVEEFGIPDGVFMVGDVPHDWLFKQVSCVVHHGGAGTTAAGIAAGRPTLIIPFYGDQPFWGAMTAQAGAGPEPIPYKQLTVDRLTDAINVCLRPESLRRARDLAIEIAAERGSDVGAQSLHQHLDIDRLRCTLVPSRPAVWRIKHTQVRLSAFAASTLANEKLLDFRDLKLFRAQEYSTDEGPWDPVSGGFTAVLGAVGGMMMGLADFPSETWKALQIPSGIARKPSEASVQTIPRKKVGSTPQGRSFPSVSSAHSLASLSKDSLARVQTPSNFSGQSSSTANVASTSMSDNLQNHSALQQVDTGSSRSRQEDKMRSGKNRDMLRPTGAHTSKGAGRFIKAVVQAPMDMTVNFTRGFHNAPKLWGDDTVRPQEKINDFKSGMKAIGREWSYGWYDGVTGLVTQPWKGAQKEGPGGFLKGVGKGVGGFVAKPGAAVCSVLGYSMKGLHKQVQKLSGGNVQSYICTTRTVQGYDEWLRSTDENREEVIKRWSLIQKHLKKIGKSDQMVRDVLEAQHISNIDDRGIRPASERAASFDPPSGAAEPQDIGTGNALLGRYGTQSTEVSLEAAEIRETIRTSVQDTSQGDPEEDAHVERVVQQSVAQLQRQRQERVSHPAKQEELRRAMEASEAEAQQHASEALDYRKRLERAMAQNMTDQGREISSGSDLEPNLGLDDEEDEEFERVEKEAALTVESPRVHRPPPYDPGNAQQQAKREEKTTQERTEEEVVMEYVKKQSLLEAQAQHQTKGKGRAIALDDGDDEDLQTALKLSMQERS